MASHGADVRTTARGDRRAVVVVLLEVWSRHAAFSWKEGVWLTTAHEKGLGIAGEEAFRAHVLRHGAAERSGRRRRGWGRLGSGVHGAGRAEACALDGGERHVAGVLLRMPEGSGHRVESDGDQQPPKLPPSVSMTTARERGGV